ncbi:MAG: hypothetical protein DLM58_19155 [Pseudonocardiales bacterium]|nr:MAG: hypothetical protein DLM58_19155 [Pseudonocardiales bacterium]
MGTVLAIAAVALAIARHTLDTPGQAQRSRLVCRRAEHGVCMGAFETSKTKAAVLQAAAPFLASQMTKVPGGTPDTGGGSTAGTQDSGLLAAGGAALLGGAGVAAYLATHRSSEPDSAS